MARVTNRLVEFLPPLPTVTRHTNAGDVQNIQNGQVPRVQGRSYAIEAELTVPEGGAEGVLVANADFIGRNPARADITAKERRARAKQRTRDERWPSP